MLKPTLVLCESHPLVQGALVSLLGEEFDIKGSIANGREVLSVARRVSPAFVVLEVALPSLNGFEVSRQLQCFETRPKVVFFTACSSPAFVCEGFRAGASAYVSKSAPAEDLLKALRAVARGQQYISLPEQQDPMMLARKDGKTQSPFGDLTPRQFEVLQLVGEGLSAKAIAAELNVVQKTVEFHKTCIMSSLKLKSSAHLVRFAVEHGLVGSLSDPNVRSMCSCQKQTLTATVELAQDTTAALTTCVRLHNS